MAPTGLLESFLAAIQASLSVLLVISYGSIAAHLGLLSHDSTKAVSKVCVRMFLPALLITKIGSELHAESASRYLIILIWAIVCHMISFLIGIVGHLFLGMPDWVTVAIMFNNTTSYPLLLITALDETGILSALIVTDETTREAIERAKAYFLVFATVSSCLTFAVGPRLIDSEHAPEPDDHDMDSKHNGSAILANDDVPPRTEESSPLLATRAVSSGSLTAFSDPFESSSSLLAPHRFFPSVSRRSSASRIGSLSNEPSPLSRPGSAPRSRSRSRSRPSTSEGRVALRPTPFPHHLRRASVIPRSRWSQLGPRTKWWLLFVSDFFNAPLLGAVIGAIIGLVPSLHTAFFSPTDQGGIFTAWLTASLKNIGGLFVPLPVVVAGVSLYTAMRDVRLAYMRSEDGEEDGGPNKSAALPWLTVGYILLVRFVLWPLGSISLIYWLAGHEKGVLGDDPMLWFAMMLMPTGPPAMKLITLIQVSDGEPEDEVNIAKLLTISYIISPILSVTVVGSLFASEATIR
ncbi:auxin efflux carrier [Rhypophila decipiens]|uniref:Auxin efflux carrier n=1 Tax=Rhypophila decipiens TaxID=261697 RepID=A0AAN6YBP8_9PEZI|nr:auxin efflux carrier [Rhypophila decipiens]